MSDFDYFTAAAEAAARSQTELGIALQEVAALRRRREVLEYLTGYLRSALRVGAVLTQEEEELIDAIWRGAVDPFEEIRKWGN